MTHCTFIQEAMRFGKGCLMQFLSAWWLVTSPLLAIAASPSHTDYNFFNLPSSGSSCSGTSSPFSLICPSNLTIGFEPGACAATVQFPMPQTLSTACPGAVNISIQTPWGMGNGPFQQVAAGVYPIECRAVNTCGDVAICTFIITVRDIKKPVLQLKSGIHGNITPDGSVRFFARQFDQNSTDDCTPASLLKFSFSNDPADTVRQFFCQNLGQHEVQIVVTDAAGNKSVGKSTLHIMDGMGYCTSTRLQGLVRTPSGQGIEEVSVELQVSGNNTTFDYTTDDGSFIFEHLKVGKNYQIRPSKNDNPLNGVNSYDLKLLNDHILGNKLLDNPYKIMAADVNGSGKVTTADMVVLRKMILGELNSFPDNTSWRFVPVGHVFPHPMNPFAASIPDKINIDELPHGMPSQDFVGIKTGDLNYSAVVNFNPSDGEDRSENNQTFFLITENQRFKKDDLVEVAIRVASQSFAPDAFQFTLHFNMNQLELLSVASGNLSGMGFENIGLSHAAEGLATLSWQKNEHAAFPGDNIIHAKFKAKAAGTLADALTADSHLTNAVAFDNQGNMHAVELKYIEQNQSSGGVELHQNAPNPFIEMTLVRFQLPQDGLATLGIYDQLGNLVFEKKGSFQQGENQILLTRSDLQHAGIYTYQVKTDYGFASRKLVMF